MQPCDYKKKQNSWNSKQPVNHHLRACQFSLEFVRTSRDIYVALVAFQPPYY